MRKSLKAYGSGDVREVPSLVPLKLLPWKRKVGWETSSQRPAGNKLHTREKYNSAKKNTNRQKT